MEWKEIEGFEKYSISNTGIIKNTKTDRIIKQSKNKGYCIVSLRKNNKKHTKIVHRLVAIAFIPQSDNSFQVDHINRIRDDNRVNNLRWVTSTANHNNKINQIGVVEHIIDLYKNGKSIQDIYKSLNYI
jgi:hypothetical protein